MSSVGAVVVVVTDERYRGLWMDFWRVSPGTRPVQYGLADRRNLLARI